MPSCVWDFHGEKVVIDDSFAPPIFQPVYDESLVPQEVEDILNEVIQAEPNLALEDIAECIPANIFDSKVREAMTDLCPGCKVFIVLSKVFFNTANGAIWLHCRSQARRKEDGEGLVFMAKLTATAEKLCREIHVFETSLSSGASQTSSNEEEPDDFYEFTAQNYYRVLST
ncbi:hypothetical protein GIB67_010956 [Kingdonia uniflora]|uniref:Uncharacterized protein n=1 Tax=Kingdonia uniflora TaxID=39325 RepID=A0A7J7NW01_9MAGN|nr:hypothetical protein GIB67_010956 [Kingdonia uniflora]